MQRLRTISILAMVSTLGLGSTLAAGPSTFDRMIEDYENIRQALLYDETEGVVEHATQIQQLAHGLEADFSEETAGIRSGRGDDLRALLPSIREAAEALAGSEAIADARQAFGTLSKAMVQYSRMTADPRSVVAFCPMVKKVWLQPKGEIGNPYSGQSMAGCGEVVSE